MPYQDDPTAFAYESVTVAAAAVGLTSATFQPGGATPARRAVLTLETAQIRYRYDGINPTATEGHLLEVGDVLTLSGIPNLLQFRAIRTGATSGTLKVTYER